MHSRVWQNRPKVAQRPWQGGASKKPKTAHLHEIATKSTLQPPGAGGANRPRVALKTRKNTCKCCTGATWRSKWPAPACSGAASALEGAVRACFSPAGALKMAALACPGAVSALGKADRACLGAASAIKMAGLACSGFGQCAQRGCPSLLRCRQCAQRGFSSVLFEIAVRKSWSRLHCALSHCTLHCFAPCMDMHGSTLVYIYIDIGICLPVYLHWCP